MFGVAVGIQAHWPDDRSVDTHWLGPLNKHRDERPVYTCIFSSFSINSG